MIVFDKILIQDFMSFGKQKVTFRPTETLVLGDNRDSCGADDNGSGKSTLAEAIRWALYGKTVRSEIDKTLPVEHVVRKGAKTALVRLSLSHDGVPLVVTRKRSKAGTTLSAVYGEQEHKAGAAQVLIEKCLGIDLVQFSNLVHLDGSYPKLFAPSTDKDRKDILADLVEVAIAGDMQAEAARRLIPITDRLEFIDREMGTCDFIIKGATEDYEREDARDTKHRAALIHADEQIKAFNAAISKLNTARDAVKKALDEVKTAAADDSADLQERIQEADQAVVLKERELEAAVEDFRIVDIDSLNSRINCVDSNINSAKKRINQIEELQAQGCCPTCGQDTEELDASEAETLTSQTKELEGEVQELKESLESVKQERREKIKSLRDDLSEAREACKSLREEANKLVAEGQREREERRKKLAAIDSKLDEANRAVAKHQTAVKLHKTEVKEARQAKLVAKTRIREAEEDSQAYAIEHVDLDQEREDLEFWKKGFGPKGVPSLFIETVLPSISMRIQKYADILTGGDVVVTLKAYRETKAKTTQEAIQISAVNSKGASVYGANSTGERNRINMAVTLGLIEYFRDMGVFQSDLLICDEIFDGLDSTGVEQGIMALREAQIDKVLVVSHHEHLQPLFPNAIHVRKEAGVSSVIGEMQ